MKEQGFSLVEVLIALAISAVIAVGSTMVLRQTVAASDTVRRVSTDSQSLLTAHRRLFDDFGAATLYQSQPVSGYGPAEGFSSGERYDQFRVAFVRDGWSNPAQLEARSDLMRIEYALEDGALVRRVWVRPDPVERTPVASNVVIEGVEQVEAGYLFDGVWSEAWPAERGGMPDAIRLDFAMKDGRTLELGYIVGAGS
ncbi:MAG: type II secretion system minor pseudopilin GspJ [Hyphomonas sp.]|nr:type II secretion system minor pseudopilin GspJ [Hyphomonas sp.]